MRTQAAAIITEALQQQARYTIVFVATLEEWSVRPQDKALHPVHMCHKATHIATTTTTTTTTTKRGVGGGGARPPWPQGVAVGFALFFGSQPNPFKTLGIEGSICHFALALPAGIWGHCSQILVFTSIWGAQTGA